MKVIIVGLGVQGKKRCAYAGDDFLASVDPINPIATFKRLEDVPLSAYDAALVCTPDEPKFDTLHYLLTNNKHVLVEKPLWTTTPEEIKSLESLAKRNNLVCYTAYNHRFEPHFINLKNLLQSHKLGKIYSCQLFYGNGTARLVRNSGWRDQALGVLLDLGSHLLNSINFWFDCQPRDFELIALNKFENQAPDQVIFFNRRTKPQFLCEVTLLSWRNHFICNVVAEQGSAHIESLCKWGPSHFIVRNRMFPSGRPDENKITLIQDDPTWQLEYSHFKQLIMHKVSTNLSNDLWIQQELTRIFQLQQSMQNYALSE